MKAELQDRLILEYPGFFDLSPGQRIHTGHDPIGKTIEELTTQGLIVVPIQFGFECGDGWYWLISNLMRSISDYCKWNKVTHPTLAQVKEKYGRLCFYLHGGNELINGMVWLAESLSADICEECGTTENVGQTRGWVYTRCSDCIKKNKNAKILEWIPNNKK